jgi:diguanylate cyclase (GGDEF)-like protein/PAS domain S-box-containing protein
VLGKLAGAARRMNVRDLMRTFAQARLAFVVLGVGVVMSFAAGYLAEQRVQAEAASEFQQQAAHAIETIDRYVEADVDLAIGLKGLFHAAGEVRRDEFRTYLAGFRLSERHPGVRVITFGQRVDGAEKDAFEHRVREDRSVDPAGYPHFKVMPGGDRAEYLVLEYIEPMAASRNVLGLDLLAEPVRAAEIALARDTGEPVASEPFIAAVKPAIAFSIRTAIYTRGMPVETVAQRRAAFRGVIAVLVDVEQLLKTILETQLGTGLDLIVHDVGPAEHRPGTPARTRLIFDSSGTTNGVVPAEGEHWTRLALLDVGGRHWRLMFHTPARVGGVAGTLPKVVLQGGLVTSLLLFWLMWTLSVSRARALQLAEQAGAVRAAESMREQLHFMQRLIEAVPQPIFFMDADGRYLGVNAAWEAFFGEQRGDSLGKTVLEVFPRQPDLAEKHRAMHEELLSGAGGSVSYDASVPGADGRRRHVIYNQATFNRRDGTVAGLIGLITDITELKDAEARLRESEARFRDLAELSSDWFWEQDEHFRFTDVAPKIEASNITAQEHIGRAPWELPVQGVSDEQWQSHKGLLHARLSFSEFCYQRYDDQGRLRAITMSGRPVFDESGAFKGYRGTARDITRQREVEDQIRHMAHHDALTGLPNRVLLYDRMDQLVHRALRGVGRFSLLFIDLDRFKNVNDTLGHKVGDRLLRVVAQRISGCVREGDTVARIGGDEFVVLLTDSDSPRTVAHVAQKVLDSLARPFDLDGYELYITPSIGICVYPDDGEDAQTLMSNADAAMYHAKDTGRNNFQFFTRQMSIAAHHRLALENELRHAVDRNELVLYYQPQIDLRTGDIVGFEALLRWNHPERGMVLPSAFIPIAEETGLINRIGEWVLSRACEQAHAWQEAGHPGLQVSVNCSAQQFRRDEYVGTIEATMHANKLPASCLELEITESVIMQHTEQVLVRLKQLHDLGVQLSLDDFGTGYSSLSYVKRFPIQKLKIDQTFVRDITADPDDAAIVTAIVAMAHSLGLVVMAEGVETRQQLAFLKALKCDQAQGYYFSPPVPAAEFEALLGNPGRLQAAAD